MTWVFEKNDITHKSRYPLQQSQVIEEEFYRNPFFNLDVKYKKLRFSIV